MNHDEDKPTTPQESNEVSHSEVIDDGQTAESQTAESQTAESQTAHEEPAYKKQQNESASTSTSDINTEKTWHNKNVMKRGIAMLGYGFIAGFVRVGITLIAIFQFFSLLFSEKPNQPLVAFGQNLNTYLYQINQFLTVNSEMYPFPFADWPDSAPKA